MSKSWNRLETWFALVVLGIGVVIMGVLGIWGYVSATTTPLHPTTRDVPASGGLQPSPLWAAAVEEARQIARMALVEQNVPGLSVAVGTGNEIVWAEGFGWADLDRREPVAPDTPFAIGTASTVLASAAAGLLIEQGALKLDEEIQTYVPEFPRKEWPVTLRRLMVHTAGVRNDGGDEGPLLSRHCERPVEALEVFAERALLFEPGTEYRYSSYGWILVSAAIEAATGEPLARFMRTEVFEPLGMDDTRADTMGRPNAGRATSYFPRFAADPRYGPDLMRPIDHSCYSGASVFVSTPTDLVRFGMGIASGRLLTSETVRLLQTSGRLASGRDTGYGLGWDIEKAMIAGEDTPVIGHDGDVLGGMVASLMMFPEHGLVVAVTSNVSYADTFAVGRRIAEAFVDRAQAATAGSSE